MILSVITATYNREHLLPVLYKSLVKNSKGEIELEWIIMDDGSVDNTETLIKSFIKEKKINIIYKKQSNQGKMIAINNAIKYAKGELLIELDSDDYMLDDAIKIIYDSYIQIKDMNDIYAMAFTRILKKYMPFPTNLYKTTIFDAYFKNKVIGDITIIYIAKIRKKYKYIVEKGEKFCTENRMNHQIDKNYYIMGFRKNIIAGNYEEDGYTINKLDLFKKYPYGYYNYFKEIFGMNMKGVTFKKRLYVIKHYILFGYLTKRKFDIKSVKGLLNKLLYFILYIPGIIKTKRVFKT